MGPSGTARSPVSATPRLLTLQTAVPSHVLLQADIRERIPRLFEGRRDIERMLPVFDHAGIRKRHSCVPLEWYERPHGWSERTGLYVEHAVALLEQVTRKCLDDAGMSPHDIDAIVVSSTTGIATPSLDALVVERLQLRRDIERLPIFGLGCAGGVIGLSRAATIAQASPRSRVLFLVVELCALTFRLHDLSKSNIVAAALFGDGAAGAILSCDGDGPAIGPAGEHTWPASLDIMGWDVEEDGLKAKFSRDIPALVREQFRDVLLKFLCRHHLSVSGFDAFACHPGGAKVLDALEETLGLPPGGLEDSRAILSEYGNMSAATALFVLERMQNRWERALMSALGPGFTAGFLVLDQR
jgi:alkylresorcinol/alkylpyrone synthase